MTAIPDILQNAAARVRDPRSGRSVLQAGLVERARLEAPDHLRFTLRFGAAHAPEERTRVRDAILRQLEEAGFRGKVTCDLVGPAGDAARAAPKAAAAPQQDPVRGMSGPGMQPHGGPFEKKAIPGVRHVVAVASGKGGVGKSTVAVNLALALKASGLRVGVMDADIYGPSVPLMLGVEGRPYADADNRIIPLEGYGMPCMSIGFLVDDGEPIIWRGPMVMGVVKQFIQDVDWGELDVLLIDLPPGTGDAQLTMIQTTPLSGAVIVTTPQEVALLDARRGVEMFRKLDVPVLGVIENMAWLDLPGGERIHPFGSGGGRATAERFQVPFLGEVPLDPRIREGGDAGRPAVIDPGPARDAFEAVAASVAAGLGLS